MNCQGKYWHLTNQIIVVLYRMNGKIKFFDLRQLADFLKEFAGSTAIFEVRQEQNTGYWILEFTGGH